MDEAKEPEDGIEHIVRQAEQEARFEFNPAAWSAMEKKLDEVQPVPFSLWKILFPIAGVAIVLMVLLWPISAQDRLARQELMLNDGTEERLDQKESQEQSSQPSRNNSTADVDTVSIAKVNPETDERPESVENSTVSTASKADAQQGVTDQHLQNEGNNQSGALQVLTRNEIETPSTEDSNENGPVGGKEETSAKFGVDFLSLHFQPAELSFPVPELVFEVDSAMFKDEDAQSYFQRSKWAVSLMLSLDMSATGLQGFTDPGTMAGLGLEYYIADSWSINSGLAIAVKKYTALGSEYETPAWIQARPEDFLSADAKCLVIDIPLNIRKYFTTKKGKTYYASTGLSSYLMLREDYNYEYAEYRPNWATFWQYRNRNKHYFGIVNLSFGYETPISQKLGIGIEPFMKLPITGIGQGKVKLLSFGAIVALKFRK